MNGADRLKKSEMEKGNKHRSSPDFHFELLRLRSNWRLKKAGNTIIGDLSYKSSKNLFFSFFYVQCEQSFERKKLGTMTLDGACIA